jgi:hypothetical protein
MYYSRGWSTLLDKTVWEKGEEEKKGIETRNEKARGICIKSTFEAKHSLVFRE